ncbi:cell wall metabolism sensor histidine kinase WalK [Flavobacterium sp. M31R6]|uniref:sensor histidine kinase n=1 Tax=Flavobacterium sp. M31R6 TaxID=2739062 RepID=UPI0020C4EE1A|nr:HAMP domain-containing sensor histidine kinase [Flavobacterium sp. M31R6]
MKIKHQLAIFNALSRLLLILVLWLMLPVLVEKVVYNHINKSLLEKKQKFIEHLDKEEINDFIVRNDTSETYASFSTLHSEFLSLSRVPSKVKIDQTLFITEQRIIEDERNDYRILQYYFKYENTNYLLEIGNSLSEIDDLTFVIRFFFIIVLIIIVVITFLADTFYIEYLLKPFYKIIDTKIRHVNEPESFDHTPIKTHSRDFQELDTVLNQMMDRITELFKKEKQFIANVSHELLTPIALLKNKFENLLQNESLDDNAVDKIVGSLSTLDLLKKIIANLLLISKIENNQYEANETIDFDAIITDLLADLQDRIEDKELSFNKNLEHHFSFRGNKTLMHILFYNLIVNAIKYNNPLGTIEIKDGFLHGNYFLSVSDSGIGMNKKQQQNVFKRFTRVSSDQEGQGLGLAIVESIAQFHHITLEITSEINIGTTFILLFPNESKPN